MTVTTTSGPVHVTREPDGMYRLERDHNGKTYAKRVGSVRGTLSRDALREFAARFVREPEGA